MYLANSVDPDEMQHNAAFHRCLHYLLRLEQPSGTEIHHNLEIHATPKNTKWTIPYFLYQYVRENPIRIQKVKNVKWFGPRSASHDLGPNCLQRLSSDDKPPLAKKAGNFLPFSKGRISAPFPIENSHLFSQYHVWFSQLRKA